MAAERELQDAVSKIATPVGKVITTAYRAATRDGTIDAFLRQGARELGSALKAFPDTMQIDEAGAVFNPIYADRASQNRADHPSPGDLALAGERGNSQARAADTEPSQGQSQSSPQTRPDGPQRRERGPGM
jgi:hypothetical protein